MSEPSMDTPMPTAAVVAVWLLACIGLAEVVRQAVWLIREGIHQVRAWRLRRWSRQAMAQLLSGPPAAERLPRRRRRTKHDRGEKSC